MTWEIFTPLEIAVGTHFHEQCGTKTTPVLLTADGKASWSLLSSLVPLLSGGTVQPENTYSCLLKLTGQIWESWKSITLITATTSIHLPRSVSTDLTVIRHNWKRFRPTYMVQSHSSCSNTKWPDIPLPWYERSKLCNHQGALRHCKIGRYIDQIAWCPALRQDRPKRRTSSDLPRWTQSTHYYILHPMKDYIDTSI